jgi:hypothetical protein
MWFVKVVPMRSVVDHSTHNLRIKVSNPSTGTMSENRKMNINNKKNLFKETIFSFKV